MSVIVYGGMGALGSFLVTYFKKKNYKVISIDIAENAEADVSLTISPSASWTEQERIVLDTLASKEVRTVDAVFCVAGGWAGGNAASSEFITSTELMWKQSVISSTIAARIAVYHLKEGGLLQLTGAAPALKGTPGMIGYGMAKAAVQQLTKSLAMSGSGLPPDATAIALLPVTLDTPNNRKFMPDADFSTWTSLDWIADRLFTWIKDKSSRPPNGSLCVLKTSRGLTTLDEH